MNKSWWQQFEGQTIENTYRLVRLLGTGGFGGVFLSDHVVEGTFVRHVAVKLVVADADQMQRQLAELVTATTLRHPSLLSCFHAGSTTFANMRLLYLVMELADEGLETRLERGVLPTSEALELTRNLAQGLAYLHERKIVHRDVKPANVLRVDGVWKLSDFGTVRQSTDTTSRTNMIIGSMAYMPPESFDGVVSPAWDSWSTGILLLRAMTGQSAFAETSEHQLIRAILDKEPAIPANLPYPFADLLRGCLTKEYRLRWNAEKIVATLAASYRQVEPAQLSRMAPPFITPKEQGGVMHTANEGTHPPTVVPLSVPSTTKKEAPSANWRPLFIAGAVMAIIAVGAYLLLSHSGSSSPGAATKAEPDHKPTGLSKADQGTFDKGVAAMRSKDYERAAQSFSEVVAANPAFVDGRVFLGKAYLEQYKTAEPSDKLVALGKKTEATFQQVLVYDARNKDALAAIACLSYWLMDLGKNPKERYANFELVKQWSEKLIEIDPGNEVAHYSIGVIDWDEADNPLMSARAQSGMRPEDEGPLRKQSVRKKLIAAIGATVDDGIRELNRAIQIAPNYDDAMAYLSLCLRLKADLAETKDDYRRYTAEAESWYEKYQDTKKNRAAGSVPPRPSSWENGPAPLPPPPPPPPAPTGKSH